MMIDATFWVAISFFIFVGVLIYFKIPKKIQFLLNENISNIQNQIESAERLKEEAKNILDEQEARIGSSKKEIKKMIDKANSDSEKNVIKSNDDFHKLMDAKKKNSEQRILQMKDQAIIDIKNSSVKIAILSVERLLKNSIDKSKLDKLYLSSIDETKLALKKKSS